MDFISGTTADLMKDGLPTVRTPLGIDQVGQGHPLHLRDQPGMKVQAGLGSGKRQAASCDYPLHSLEVEKELGLGPLCCSRLRSALAQGGLGHSWSCHNIDLGGDNIQRAWSPSRIRRGMSPEKIPGPQGGSKTNGGF